MNQALHGDFIAYRPSFAAPPETSVPPKRRYVKPVAKDRTFPKDISDEAKRFALACNLDYLEDLHEVLQRKRGVM